MSRIGKRMSYRNIRKLSLEKDIEEDKNDLKEFQKNYIKLWLDVYSSPLNVKQVDEIRSKLACDEFFKEIGRPNGWYYNDEELKLVLQDAIESKYD